jgi:hypothetical protein
MLFHVAQYTTNAESMTFSYILFLPVMYALNRLGGIVSLVDRTVYMHELATSFCSDSLNDVQKFGPWGR